MQIRYAYCIEYKIMKNYTLLLGFLLVFVGGVSAQTSVETDTLVAYHLQDVSIKARFKNDTERYKYNQMKYYVTTVLPYMEASTAMFNEINNKINSQDISRGDRKRFIAQKQDQMKAQFEDKIKGLNVTQGALLVKLIARQTNLNIYKMVAEVKNPVVAMKWQVWARLNGMNLDKKYRPEEEPVLEEIMNELGYALPQSYAIN